MKQTLFTGITGLVRIDDNGDRDADYSLLDLDPVTGRFEVVSHYYGSNRWVFFNLLWEYPLRNPNCTLSNFETLRSLVSVYNKRE